MRRVLILLFLLLGAVRADASGPRAQCFDNPERWSYDRSKETLAEPGQRFMRDLRACDPTLAANIEESVRYEIQEKEAEQFRRHETYVIAAYGIAWGLVALAALAVWLRWRRVQAAIAALEAKVPK